MPEQLAPPQGTPAGEGVLTDQVGNAAEYIMGTFLQTGHAWVLGLGYQKVIVYPGVDASNEAQGVVIVVRPGTIWSPFGAWVETPRESGSIRIADAVGQRLVIRSESGQTFYFDVPAGRFVRAMNEHVPTMTPGPTLTPEPTREPRFYSDDAPDDPGEAQFRARQFDTRIIRFVNPAWDQDWFVFNLRSTSDISIVLDSPRADFGLRVMRLSDDMDPSSLKEWTDYNLATSSKVISIPQAPPCLYYVEVMSLNGSADPQNPYVLEARSQ